MFLGFAIKLDVVLQSSTAEINPDSRIGWLESDFLSQMVQPSDAEGRASNCKKVLFGRRQWDVVQGILLKMTRKNSSFL